MALTIVLYHCLMSELNMQLTQAAAIISSMIGKIERTVRERKSIF